MRDYEPWGGAIELLKARESEVVASGPAGTGKSLGALFKAHITAAKVSNCMQLILRQTSVSLARSTLVTFEKQVAVNELAEGKVTWFGGSGRKPACYEYPNGSRIYVGGLDKPGAFLSMDLDRIYVDEASQTSIVAHETLLTRLRGKANTYRQIMLMTNPDHDQHWINERAASGKMRMITSQHTDNPFLYNRDGTKTKDGEAYLEFLGNLTGVRRERYLLGRWCAAEGQVFDDWDDAVNLVDPFPVPAEWRSVWTWDQGFQNPQVFQRWVIDGDERLYLTHEMSRRQRLVEDFAADIKELAKVNGWSRPEAFVADHDAGDRATMERHIGITTVPAKKGVTRGVQLTQARIRKAGDGKPRLLVFRDALIRNDPLAASDKRPRGFSAEVGGYVWMMERGTDGIPKEAPQKLNDHSMDAGRYAVAYLDWNEPSKIGNPAKAASARPTANASKWSTPTGNPNSH